MTSAATGPAGPVAPADGWALRCFMRRWATGVAVVTGMAGTAGVPEMAGMDGMDGIASMTGMTGTSDGTAGRIAGRPVGCTVTAFTSVSLDPPQLLVCLGRHSRTRSAIAERPVFGVNVLSARQRDLAEAFAAPAGDRFRNVPFRLVHDVPVLDDAFATVVCAVRSAVPAGDHDLVVGAPLWYGEGAGRSAPPLLHYAGGLVADPVADPVTDLVAESLAGRLAAPAGDR